MKQTPEAKLKEALFERANQCDKLTTRYELEVENCTDRLNRQLCYRAVSSAEFVGQILQDLIDDCGLTDEYFEWLEKRRSPMRWR